ncbi:hypothetical protein [Agromyces aerolatus]|uniref:hypothetical protein n=1 Tax=Agromyces sp. LY-1074 TaxID=3074080 RepID=UPI0028645101|nr:MULTISPECIES: hypothetical protein [unclassified Agromyces]MDR5700150.1 hypothetical protein [Agromyces sp. LY-1074]MDR5706482.1 hypothetical protein [Agromyces sp. LY-1358]
MLRGFEEIVPGAAERLLDSHLRSQDRYSGSIARLSSAEAFAVRFGVIGAYSLAMTGMIVAIGFVIAGMPAVSVAALIPAILGSAAQLVAVRRAQK